MPGPYGYSADTEKRIEQRELEGCEACGCNDDRFRVVLFERTDDGLHFEVECELCPRIEAARDEAEIEAYEEDAARG